MKKFTLYAPDGRIRQSGTCEDRDFAHQSFPGCALTAGSGDPLTDHVDLSGLEPVIRPRQTIAFDKTEIAADGIDAATLDLGRPFTAVVNGVVYEVDTEPYVLVIRSTMAGARWRVQVEHPAFLPLDLEVVSHAP